MAKTAHFSAILVCFALYVGHTSTVSCADLLTIPPCVAEFKRGVLNGALPTCIENLQKGLRLLKTPGLVVDGLFGEDTESAVKLFQRTTNGLVEDGWVGPLTRAKLNEEYEMKSRPQPPTPSPTTSPRPPGSRNYVALGDSYAAGIGAGESTGTCKQTPNSWAYLVAKSIGTYQSQPNLAACSGFEIPQVYGTLNSLNASTEIITLSIGGNDAFFEDTLKECGDPLKQNVDIPFLPNPNPTCLDAVRKSRDLIKNTLRQALPALYERIRENAENADLYVVGYPRLFGTSECNFATTFSEAEISSLNGLADDLATVIKSAAESSGARFVDTRQRFSGHEICSSEEWINGYSGGDDKEYHPNIAGQLAYAQVVVSCINQGVCS